MNVTSNYNPLSIASWDTTTKVVSNVNSNLNQKIFIAVATLFTLLGAAFYIYRTRYAQSQRLPQHIPLPDEPQRDPQKQTFTLKLINELSAEEIKTDLKATIRHFHRDPNLSGQKHQTTLLSIFMTQLNTLTFQSRGDQASILNHLDIMRLIHICRILDSNPYTLEQRAQLIDHQPQPESINKVRINILKSSKNQHHFTATGERCFYYITRHYKTRFSWIGEYEELARVQLTGTEMIRLPCRAEP